MADPNWIAALHGVIALVCGLPAGNFGWSAYKKHVAATSVLRARPVDPSAQSDREISTSDWAAVKGEVSCNNPIHTSNGTEAAVVETTWEKRRFSSDEPAWSGGRRVVLDTSWREGNWHLASGASSPTLISVEKDAIRQAAERDPASVSALVPAGALLDVQSQQRSPWTTLVQLLLGYYEEGPWKVERALPVGLAVTIVGRLDERAGTFILRPHPSLGLFMYSTGLEDTVWRYRWQSGIEGSVAAVFGGFALWNARKAVLTKWPWLSSWQRTRQYLVSRGWWPRGSGTPADDEEGEQQEQQQGGVAQGRRARPRRFAPDTPSGPGDECIACTENKRCIVSVPCGHVSLCGACATRLWEAALRREQEGQGQGRQQLKCPMCRAECTDMLRMFGEPERSSQSA